MSQLLVYPDPPPPELAQSLDLAGFSWKAVANSTLADEKSIDQEWGGAVIVADEDPNDAFAFARFLRKKPSPQQGILILLNATQLGQLELRDELFDDFILTPFRHQELEARLKHLFWSQGVDSRGEVLSHGDLILNLETYQAAVNGRPLDLTYMEYELLKFLVTHPGKVFSRETLLSRVWGYDYFGGARTVDVHVRRLRSKLGEEFAGLIQTVRSVGYSFGQSRWNT
ncbi:MAG: transcriptional regulator [Acidimicrobiaceae bacterium]|jgi:DNA-binding response OmpR family regulator|nr:transcriptional regulator [Acidimicrobiaceae bacterium]|tara:strand:+ start:72086 stop:72766 length:681 start_codon:yes stop_codon:yes gene_type:complete